MRWHDTYIHLLFSFILSQNGFIRGENVYLNLVHLFLIP